MLGGVSGVLIGTVAQGSRGHHPMRLRPPRERIQGHPVTRNDFRDSTKVRGSSTPKFG